MVITTYSAENFSLGLVGIDVEAVAVEIMKTDHKHQAVWHISLVRDGEP